MLQKIRVHATCVNQVAKPSNINNKKNDASQVHGYLQIALFCMIMVGMSLSREQELEDLERKSQQTLSDSSKPPISKTALPPVTLDPSPSPISTETQKAPEPYPSNIVRWGRAGRPDPLVSGQFEIWDRTGSPMRKIVRLRPAAKGNGINMASERATIFLEPGGRISIQIDPGTYEITAMAGEQWNGHDFGSQAYAVRYRDRAVATGELTVLVIGAVDEPVSSLSRDAF